jgi:hypothetical protein
MDEKPRNPGRGVAIIVVLAAVPVLYVLSIGPADVLVRTGMIPNDTAVLVYMPITLLCQWEPARSVMEWYVSQWSQFGQP